MKRRQLLRTALIGTSALLVGTPASAHGSEKLFTKCLHAKEGETPRGGTTAFRVFEGADKRRYFFRDTTYVFSNLRPSHFRAITIEVESYTDSSWVSQAVQEELWGPESSIKLEDPWSAQLGLGTSIEVFVGGAPKTVLEFEANSQRTWGHTPIAREAFFRGPSREVEAAVKKVGSADLVRPYVAVRLWRQPEHPIQVLSSGFDGSAVLAKILANAEGL